MSSIDNSSRKRKYNVIEQNNVEENKPQQEDNEDNEEKKIFKVKCKVKKDNDNKFCLVHDSSDICNFYNCPGINSTRYLNLVVNTVNKTNINIQDLYL